MFSKINKLPKQLRTTKAKGRETRSQFWGVVERAVQDNRAEQTIIIMVIVHG